MAPIHTVATSISCTYTCRRSASSRVGTRMAVMMISPPMVGVPRLLVSPASPSSRMPSLICFFLRKRISFLPYTSVIKSESSTASSTRKVMNLYSSLPGKCIPCLLSQSNRWYSIPLDGFGYLSNSSNSSFTTSLSSK